MARLLGPDVASRLAIRFNRWTDVPESYALRAATIYVDEAATTPADIAAFTPEAPGTPGPSIPGASVTLDANSRFPLFWFPDGVDTVWGKIRGTSSVFKLGADVDARLDALGAGGGPSTSDGMVNVKAYGAVGDGTTDDTAAIAAALNAAALATPSNMWSLAKVVYFPPGSYLTGPIVLPHRVGLKGASTTTVRLKLKANAGVNANLITNQQNYSGVNDAQLCTIRDLWLDGNRPNQLAGSWNSGIVLNNSTPSGTYQTTDGRHQVSNVWIENFTGSGLVQAGRGGSQFSDINVWNVGRFGFNCGIDCEYVNCESGGTGLDGWLIQGNNLLSNCKAWYAGSSLVTGRSSGQPSTAQSVTPAVGGFNWDGVNVPGLTYSLANGWGNGFHWAKIENTTYEGNYNGGTAAGCCAQDNARAGFRINGSRMTLSGCEADSNSATGTSDGTATGAQLGLFAGFELTSIAFDNGISGMSWDRVGTFARQGAALAIASGASRNRIELTFRGQLLDGSNMPPLAAGSVVGNNLVQFRAQGGGVNAAAYAASYTPDPFAAELHTMTLTGPLTLANPAMAGTNTTGVFLVQGMTLTVVLTQDATGARAVSFGNAYKLGGFIVDPTAGSTTVLRFVYDGTSWQVIGGTHPGRSALMRSFQSQAVPARPAAGEYHVTLNSGTSTGTGWTLGEVRYQKISLAVATTFSGLAVSTSTVAAGGTTPQWRMGIYADDGTGTKPTGSPLAGTEVSTAADSGTGARDAAFPGGNITFQPGEYWLASMLTSAGGTALTTVPTMTVVNAVMALGSSNLTNVSHRCWSQSQATTATTLPAVSGLGRASAPPIVGAKVV